MVHTRALRKLHEGSLTALVVKYAQGTNIHLCCCFQQKLKLGTREQEEVSRLSEEVQLLRAELGSVQGGLGAREARDRRELQTRLQSHQEIIADIKTELQYQVQSS